MASVADGFSFDVFVSFRGEDTRHGFTSHLWKALNERGIHTFFDEKDIQKGEEITPTLVKAIDESRMAIIVLSENYASSSFCLQELSQILECIKEKGRCVWPVFYDVDPSDVRKLTGTYGKAMAKHKATYKNHYMKGALSKLTDIAAISYKNDNKEKLKKWKNSLQKVANLSGISYKNDNKEKLKKWKNSLQQVAGLSGFTYSKGDEHETELIEKIVQEVSSKINPGPNYRVKRCKKSKEAFVSRIGITFLGIICPGMLLLLGMWSLIFCNTMFG